MPDPESIAEADLLERAIGGDARAFGLLYRSHLERIYRYVAYRVSDPDDAEDLTETVFLKAWQALPDYRQAGLPWAAWLYRIAGNAVIDYYRTQRQHATLDEAMPSGEPEPLDSVSAEEEFATLRAALRRLSPEHQQVLLLRFVEGLSHADVARLLGKSEGATRVIQHRALAALAALLGSDVALGRQR